MHTMLFRVDGSPEIGAGHVMRCLSLAQELQDAGGDAVFLCKNLNEAYGKRLQQEGCTVLPLKAKAYGESDAEETLSIANDQEATWIILDGYDFDAAYQKHLTGKGAQILVIDDHRFQEHHVCDMLLNQNPQCDRTYEYADAKKMLLGTRYTMLRREYRKRSPDTYAIPEGPVSVLVTLGGSDPKQMTPLVLRALSSVSIPMRVTVILGGANANATDVEKIASASPFPVEILQDVRDMPEAICGHTLAISAAGSTCYELAYMGIPMITIIVATNHNQDCVAEGLSRAGAARNLGLYDTLTEEHIAKAVRETLSDQDSLRRMSACARKVVDGEGAPRVLQQMVGNRLRLNMAKQEHCRMIWEWANDPATRKASFSSEPIPWDDHVRWFEGKLKDNNNYCYIGWNEEDEPVGQVRFECVAGKAIISVNIAPNMRGKKYGTELIALGCRIFFATGAANTIRALIKPENTTSIAVFEKTGFEAKRPMTIKGHTALHYTLEKDNLCI